MRKILPLLLILSACTKPVAEQPQSLAQSPSTLVKAFVELSGGAKDATDRKKLLDMCAGEMRRAFDRMSDDEFKMAYLNEGVKVVDLKIVDTKVADNSAVVRYQVTVENALGTDRTTEVNEREVELTSSRGQWYLESIRLKGSDKLSFTRGMIF